MRGLESDVIVSVEPATANTLFLLYSHKISLMFANIECEALLKE